MTRQKQLKKAEAKRYAFDDLQYLLKKLGLRSTRPLHFGSTLSMAIMQRAVDEISNNYGTPDQIIMNPDDMRVFQRAFKK